MGFTFRKEERVCSRQLMDQLYTEGRRLMAFPFSVQWMKVEKTLPAPCQVMIVAPKRKFHHAVDRNHVRRLTRECYRLRKPAFYQFLQEHDLHITLSLVYVHNEMMTYEQLGKKMDKLFDQLEKAILEA